MQTTNRAAILARADVEITDFGISVRHLDRLLGGLLLATSPRVDWAKLLHRTYAVDVLRCGRCGRSSVGPIGGRAMLRLGQGRARRLHLDMDGVGLDGRPPRLAAAVGLVAADAGPGGPDEGRATSEMLTPLSRAASRAARSGWVQRVQRVDRVDGDTSTLPSRWTPLDGVDASRWTA